jgi:hypothetical protein
MLLWWQDINLLSRDRVNIDGVWIANWIYWTLTDPWLQVIITVSLIHTLYTALVHTLRVFSDCCVFTCLLATAFNGGRSSSSGLPNCPRPQLPVSHGNSSQELNRNSPLTNSLTNQLIFILLTPDSSFFLRITTRHGPRRKRSSSVALQLLHSCLLAEQRLLYSRIFRGRCPAAGLHATIYSYLVLNTLFHK